MSDRSFVNSEGGYFFTLCCGISIVILALGYVGVQIISAISDDPVAEETTP